MTLRRAAWAVVVTAGLVLTSACSSSEASSDATAATAATTSAKTSTTVASTEDPSVSWAPAVSGRKRLVGFDEVLATVTAPDGTTCQVCLLHAVSDAQRQRGLMFVTDPALGGYDGMLFSFSAPISGGFWMRHTRIPLTGVFLSEGAVVDAIAMEPCTDETSDSDCPRYGPSVPYSQVIELAEHRTEELLLTDGATVTIVAPTCPEQLAGRS